MVVFTPLVGNGHVGLEGSKILGPTGLAAGEITLGEEVAEGVVVSEEGKLLATFKVVAEDFDSMDNGEEFLFMDRVVLLGRGQFAGFIANGLGPITLILEENGTKADEGGIGVENEGGIGSGEGNNKERG